MKKLFGTTHKCKSYMQNPRVGAYVYGQGVRSYSLRLGGHFFPPVHGCGFFLVGSHGLLVGLLVPGVGWYGPVASRGGGEGGHLPP